MTSRIHLSENAAFEPLLEPIPETQRQLGMGRSTIYEVIKANQLEAVKIGRSTRIVVASRRAFVESLRSAKREAA
jgi:excisionase family DNA binding protein